MSDIIKDAKQELDRLARDRDFSLVARVLSKHVEDVERRGDGLQAENTRLVLENRDLRSAYRVRRRHMSANKPYTVHHWDTFDNETFQLGSFETLGEAEQFVEDRYQGRIRPTGADKVDIVLQGRIVRQYAVG